jgi:hypothetical protein
MKAGRRINGDDSYIGYLEKYTLNTQAKTNELIGWQ